MLFNKIIILFSFPLMQLSRFKRICWKRWSKWRIHSSLLLNVLTVIASSFATGELWMHPPVSSFFSRFVFHLYFAMWIIKSCYRCKGGCISSDIMTGKLVNQYSRSDFMLNRTGNDVEERSCRNCMTRHEARTVVHRVLIVGKHIKKIK